MSTRPRARVLALIATLLLLGLIAVPTHAQDVPTTGFYGVRVTAQTVEETIAPGGCVDYTVTVENTGQHPVSSQAHTIALSITQPPSGWTFDPALPASVDLPPGERTTRPLGLCAPAEITRTESATVTITATVTNDFGDPPARSTTTVEAVAHEESLFGVDVPDTYLFFILGGIGVLIVIVILTRRKQRNAITISCREAVKEVQSGRGTSFPVRVRNDGSERDLVNLTTSSLPAEWDLFLPLADLALDPREEQTVWLSVRAAETAAPGQEVPIRVTATSTGSGGDQATIELRTRVIGDGATPRRPEEEPLEMESEGETSVLAPERTVAVKRRKSA
ncbi:MAG: hypothetical protein KY455_11160 [Euryarchaeota archaeon]|nr:hypothetical protein [Euryarchaeota archaeon]